MIYPMIGFLIILAFLYLIYQSKRPSGLIGLWMMRLWNRVYMPMVVWAVSQLDYRKRFKAIFDVGVGKWHTHHTETNR